MQREREKTLGEILGLREEVLVGDTMIRRGHKVRVKSTGRTYKVTNIGRHGLVALEGHFGVMHPRDLEPVRSGDDEIQV